MIGKLENPKLESRCSERKACMPKLLDQASKREFVPSIVLAMQPLIIQAVTAHVSSAMEAAVKQLLSSDGLSSLKSQTQKTKFDIDSLEQYGRKENIRIFGVEKKAGENTNEVVMNIAKDLGVDITESDISVSHRLPGRRATAGSAK